MAFTSWSALRTSILNDIADSSFLTKSYSVQGRNHTFRSHKEVQGFLAFIEQQMMAEDGNRVNYAEFQRPS